MSNRSTNPIELLKDKTLVDMLCRQSACQPDKIAFTFLEDGECNESNLTYTGLNQKARVIAAKIQEIARPGDRVLLIYPPGLEFISTFMGCIYGGVIPVPVYPPDPGRLDRSLPRLLAIAGDAQAFAVLTEAAFLEFGKQFAAMSEDLSALQWIGSDTLNTGSAKEWRRPELFPDSLAFIQYTSGSTGIPRGVMVSHYNALTNVLGMHLGLRTDEDSHLVSWLPLYHDLGLVANVLETLFVGAHGILLSPIDFLRRPARWLEAITRFRADISMAPNFAYDLCVRKVSEHEKSLIDLSSWRVAGNGAEPVRLRTLRRFHQVFNVCGFRFEAFNPLYGLAESTVAVSCKPTPESPLKVESDLVSCGKYSWLDQKLLIVDPVTLFCCEEGKEGEIWLSSSSVSKGYWNRREETSAAFGAFLAEGKEGPFLRTGDLGYICDEQVFVTGRLKDLIIIRGNNHYPQDIEQSVEESSPLLRPGCCAAFSVVIDDEERLVVAQEVNKEILDEREIDAALRAIRHAVSRDHAVQVQTVVLLMPRSIPKTSSGKIRRRRCRKEYLSGVLEVIASDSLTSPNNGLDSEAGRKNNLLRHLEGLPVERRRELLSEYLRRHLADLFQTSSPDMISNKKRISELGLDLEKAIVLRDKLQHSLGFPIRSTIAFDYPTIESLAAYLAEKTIEHK